MIAWKPQLKIIFYQSPVALLNMKCLTKQKQIYSKGLLLWYDLHEHERAIKVRVGFQYIKLRF